MSNFVLSLDFELFWGVADSKTISAYRKHIEGEWFAIPGMLALFRKYGVKATWATVGMVMCRDYAHWCATRPSILPSYSRPNLSPYSFGPVVREYPRLFFARDLVERIVETPGQELATHTYSHFYCDENGVTARELKADLQCAQIIGGEMGIQCESLVFPRNQVRAEFLSVLAEAGIKVYRGNPDHWLYRSGHRPPGGLPARLMRLADSWVPLTGHQAARVKSDGGLVNVPASLFLRPWSRRFSRFESIRLARVKNAMTHAAKVGGDFHLWWHPHNFGVNVEQNLAVLESVLQHYVSLRDAYGMRSSCMREFAASSLGGSQCGATGGDNQAVFGKLQ